MILQSRAEIEKEDMSARAKGNSMFSVSHLQNKNCKTDNCFAVFIMFDFYQNGELEFIHVKYSEMVCQSTALFQL